MNYWPLVALPLLVGGRVQEKPRFRVDVQVVQVDVFASQKGKALLGLGKGDFELFDNGVRQEIELVRQEELPLDVVLVLDTSDSVAGGPLSHLKSGAHAFLRGLGAADRAALLSFSHYVHERSDLTGDLVALHEMIDGLAAGGRTAWRDALFAGLELVEGNLRRTVVLLFTDGEDTYSWLSEERIPPLARQATAAIYAISKSSRRPRPRFDGSSSEAESRESSRASPLLKEITRIAGGRLLETDSAAQLEASFLEILRELKTRYVLSYRPQGVPEEGWHTLEVKLRGRAGEVRARSGYVSR